jgi:hypothetical protein
VDQRVPPQPPRRRHHRRATLTRNEADCLAALRAIGTDVHVGQFSALDMRVVAKLVKKGRARWTAYGVRLKVKREE